MVVDREEHAYADQTHDVGIIYTCDNTWELHAKINTTMFTEDQLRDMVVQNFDTCRTSIDGTATTPEE